jgi:sec-independent protein translocase protein TatC
VLLFLQLANVVSSRRLLRSWRGAIVVVFASAAIITPSQDPWTLLAMALPMTIFYFAAIGIGRFVFRR